MPDNKNWKLPWGNSYWPWETEKGEGFMAPWTPKEMKPSGRMGRPPETQLTSYAASMLSPESMIGTTVAKATPAELVRKAQEDKQKLIDSLIPPGGGDDLPGYASFADARNALPNDNWEVTEQDEFGRWRIGKKAKPPIQPEGLTPAQKVEEKIAQTKLDQDEQAMKQRAAETAATQARQAEQDRLAQQYRQEDVTRQQQQYGMEQQATQRGYDIQQQNYQAQQQYQQQQLAWQREQEGMRQQEMQTQERARLQANPMSWLQYENYTGGTPSVQPWMLPLMPQQQGWQVGEQIPGYDPENMQNLPSLQRPSGQLWGRMGPTAQSQYMGYQQAATGIRPEEEMFRQRASAPPSGRNQPLRWSR